MHFYDHSNPLKLCGEQPVGSLLLPNQNIVFVIDDTAAMLMSVKRLLRANGYDNLLFLQRRQLKITSISGAGYVVLDINLGDGCGI